MPSSESSPLFAGAIPQFYAQYLVPILFQPYAADLASRVVETAKRLYEEHVVRLVRQV